MDVAKFFIPIDNPKSLFDQHLKLENNFRIFFSGAFGIGKTFFLKKYFSENKSYLPIHIFPINYHINTNEDIFELIKYDILLELVSLGWLDNENDLSKSVALQEYLLSNGMGLVKLLENIPK
ncbi:NTPase KAP, partial [Bacteroidota bacterium]